MTNDRIVNRIWKGVLTPLFISVLVLSLCSIGMGIASAQTAVSIEPLTKTVGQGETFNLNITVDPTVAIAGAQCDMSFNSSLVIVNSVTEGNLLKQDGAGAYFAIQGIDNVNGTVTGIAGAITSPGETVSTKGTFAIVSLTAKGVDGITGIDLSKVIVGDIDANEVDIAVSNGSVTVTGVIGDVTGEGSVNVLDMIRVGQQWAATGTPGWIPEDAKKDGVINVLDMILIGQHWTG